LERARRLALLGALLTVPACTMVGSGARPGPVRAVHSAALRPPPATAGLEPGSENEPGFDPRSIPDAVPPESEPPSAYGNPDEYEVFGKRYRVLDTSAGYEEEGEASWYGEAFDGRPTSSREPFDRYAMTAAHRTLPLPTYVEVENLENGRTAVVRVNDRGPFHDGRIIDLSYAAALKLGFVAEGVARVRVRAVGPVQVRR